MTSAVEQIRAMVDDEDTFAKPYGKLLPLQIAAVNEHLATLRERIPLLERRASEAGVTGVSSLADMLPLLLPHSAYKSYPHAFLLKGQWAKLYQWLRTVAALPGPVPDFSGVTDFDHWLAVLEAAGNTVTITSGTSGKPSLLNIADADKARVHQIVRNASFIDKHPKPARRWHYFQMAPKKGPYAMLVMSEGLAEYYGRPDSIHYLGDEPLLASHVLRATEMRNRMADGSLSPQDLANFEAESQQRQAKMAENFKRMVAKVAELRHEPFWISGPWPQLWQLIEMIRASAKPGDFHPDSIIIGGGGKKGAVMPDDYEDQVAAFFGVPKRSTYGMSEMSGAFRSCEAGRFHALPHVVICLMDDAGERVLDTRGVVTGRFAFIDLVWEGRWGGLITGDRVTVDYGDTCPCGRPGPTVLPDILRYKDIGDDKIGCAGTIDAYITGLVT